MENIKCTCLRPQVNCFSGMCSYCNRPIVKQLTTEDLKPKQEPCDNCNNEACCCIIKKQETIETAFESFMNKNFSGQLTIGLVLAAMKFGVYWQQDKNKYSEEEVLNFTQTMIMQYKFGNTNIEQMDLLKETLKQFKNK